MAFGGKPLNRLARLRQRFQTGGMARLLTLLMALFSAAYAQAQCRQALVLALDVSGSVNSTEYRQQLDGIAGALLDPQVLPLILENPDAPIALMVFEWSSQNHQIIIQPWQFLRSRDDVARAAQRIKTMPKQRQGLKTAMGDALAFAANHLNHMSGCWQLTIDISADGQSNIGPNPRTVLARSIFERTTVNALIIGGPKDGPQSQTTQALETYFASNVLHGPGAFAITAQGYSDYKSAMTQKLIKELQPVVLGASEFQRFPL